MGGHRRAAVAAIVGLAMLCATAAPAGAQQGAGPNIRLTAFVQPPTVSVNRTTSIVLAVQNLGTEIAEDVVATVDINGGSLPGTTTVRTLGAGCTLLPPSSDPDPVVRASCVLGDVEAQADTRAIIEISHAQAGTYERPATATVANGDVDLSDNTDSAVCEVTPLEDQIVDGLIALLVVLVNNINRLLGG